jgi:DNA-binding beta-propeller fold protein YncE
MGSWFRAELDCSQKNQHPNAEQQMKAKQAIVKTTIRTSWGSLLAGFLGTLLAGQACGQIFVTNSGTGTIGEYDYNTGGTVNAALVSGLNYPWGIAVSGVNLFVANNTAQTIGKYNATTGATVNASLVSGLNGPDGIAISGANLLVANSGYGSGTTIGAYNATTGATVKAALVSGLSSPTGIAVSGGYVFVANINSGTIGKYNATTGATVKAPLVSGLSSPSGIAVSGASLYVVNSGSGTIGEYNATSGAAVNASLVSGLSSPQGIAVVGANLFVVNQGTGTIGEYNATTGVTVNASLVSGLSNPIGIAVVAEPTLFNHLTPVTLQANAWGGVTVNEALNKIYTSGNGNSNCDIEVTVIDGNTFAIKDVGYGSQVSVDNKTNNYWAATIYGSSGASFGCPSPPSYPAGVIVRDGTTDDVVATVDLGPCPIATTYDFFKSRVWVGAQCGGGNDLVYAIDANKFQVIAGTPKGSNGVMGSVIANGANGRLYIYDPTPTPLSERVNPTTFAVTENAFGQVRAINGLTNTLYAVSGNTLQLIHGAPDPEVVYANIPLSYSPGGIGINTASNYLYIANPDGQSIEVRNGSTGALISTFALSTFGATPNGAMAVDSIRSRIYVIQNPSNSSAPMLLVIEDVINGVAKANCVVGGVAH